MRMRIKITKMMLILADPDPDPQHCPWEHEQTKYLVSPTSGAEPAIVPGREAGIWLQVENTQHALDPDPTVYPNADTVPDPDPSFQIKAQPLEKVLK